MRVRSLLPRKTRFGANTLLGAFALGGGLMASASAFAQAAGGTIGAQIGTMSQEFSTAGGTAASTAMYVAALITFVAGAWYLGSRVSPRTGKPARSQRALLVSC